MVQRAVFFAKSLAEFAPRSERRNIVVFCRGVYVAKHTSQTTQCANVSRECAEWAASPLNEVTLPLR